MQLGKVPGRLLERLFNTIETKDPQVILGPRLGEDVALLDTGPCILAAKTDPITFATDLIGWYAVQINATDIACSAATPRWFLATLMLHPSVIESDIESIFQQILKILWTVWYLIDRSLSLSHIYIYNLESPIWRGARTARRMACC